MIKVRVELKLQISSNVEPKTRNAYL